MPPSPSAKPDTPAAQEQDDNACAGNLNYIHVADFQTDWKVDAVGGECNPDPAPHDGWIRKELPCSDADHAGAQETQIYQRYSLLIKESASSDKSGGQKV